MNYLCRGPQLNEIQFEKRYVINNIQYLTILKEQFELLLKNLQIRIKKLEKVKDLRNRFYFIFFKNK